MVNSNYTECSQYTQTVGQVGGDLDLVVGAFIASRMMVTRASTAGSINGGVPAALAVGGWFLGLAPAEFLLLGRTAGCAIGDTVTVNGKTFESVLTPALKVGLFICTQPDV